MGMPQVVEADVGKPDVAGDSGKSMGYRIGREGLLFGADG
jgi:hypothetical protein